MLPDRLDEITPEVLYGILKILNIDYGEFMFRLINDKPFEVMVYAKIFSLHQTIKENKQLKKDDTISSISGNKKASKKSHR